MSSLPLTNSERFLHRESIEYARATFSGSRVFQPSSARRTFWIALSSVKGGKGGALSSLQFPWFFLLQLHRVCPHYQASHNITHSGNHVPVAPSCCRPDQRSW